MKKYYILNRKIILIFCFFLTQLLLCADLNVHNIEKGTVVLDGKLQESVWQKAPKGSGFSRFAFHKNETSLQQTEFSILSDSEYIFIGAVCYEPSMDKLRAGVTLKDNPDHAWNDDLLEIFLCPSGMSDTWYQFVATAGGALWSQFYAEKGAIKPDFFRPYWKSAVHKGKDFWSIEIQIPISSLYMTTSVQWKTDWLFNIGRQRGAATMDCSSWSKLNNAFNETQSFKKVSGFPSKPAELDIYLKNAKAEIASMTSSGYAGSVIVGIETSPAARGDFELKIKIGTNNYTRKIKLPAGYSSVTYDSVLFPKTRTEWISLELTDTSGKMIMGRYYPISLQYESVTWKMIKPEYKKSFFPGQDSSIVQGQFILRIGKNEAMPLTDITLKADNSVEYKAQTSIKGNEVHFTVDLKNTQWTAAVINAVSKRGSTVLDDFSGSVKIRNLPQKKGMDTLYVENGVVTLNGKKRILLSFFAADWIVGESFKAKFPTPYDKCSAIDIRYSDVIGIETGRLIAGSEKSESHLDMPPSQAMYNAIKKRVEENRNTTNKWFYYLADEPECRQLSPVYLKYCYDYITELDPYHPVLIISRSPGTYAGCADVLATHSYTSPFMEDDGIFRLSNPVKTIRDHAKPLLDAERGDISWHYCPQIFSYRFINRFAEYPRFDDSMAAVWSAIANGCMGINAYTYNGLMATPDLDFGYLWMFSTLQAIEEILTFGIPQPVSVQNTGDLVDARLLQYQNAYMLILVNVMNQPVKSVISSKSLEQIKLMDGLWEKGKVNVNKGKLEVTFKPWQVSVFTSGYNNKEIVPINTVTAAIAAEKLRIEKRKNLLSGFRRKVEITISPMSWNYYSVGCIDALLFDGNIYAPAFYAVPQDPDKIGWFEISFPDGSPKFSKMALHHANVNNVKIQIWKYGEWMKLPEKSRKDTNFLSEIDFGSPFSTVKFRMEFDPIHTKAERDKSKKYEMYEIELFE